MKKVFLPVFMLLIGMSTVVMAQAPCKTKDECESLRTKTHAILTGQKASQAVHTSLDQQVDKQIKDLPWLWPQGNIIQGVQWSGILDGGYDNLDLDPKNFPVKNEIIIQKSKATEACKAIGGRLPTKSEYKKLEADWKGGRVPAHFSKEMKAKLFWSSFVVSYSPDDAYVFDGDDGYVGRYGYRDRFCRYSVRCVGR